MSKKKVIIIGAGPAGLACAYEFLKKSNDYDITILEKQNSIGGISKTITYHHNKMDLGGHRFFSKNDYINQIWKEILPIQENKSLDGEILTTNKLIDKDGKDPDECEKVFLIRNRMSRIYYAKKFFDYPVSLTLKTIKNMGFITTLESAFSYLKSIFFKREETNLENFYINRFGKKLYHLFFKAYTQKVWGKDPQDISPDWGKQRVKGLSIFVVLKNAMLSVFRLKPKDVETSLIEKFYYPKYGPGQMWDEMAKVIKKSGGKIISGADVVKIEKRDHNIISLTYLKNNREVQLKGDIYVSSMPLKDFATITNGIPKTIKKIATNLPYRDFITVGLVVKKLKLHHERKIKTVSNLIPDCWIYIQEPNIMMGRVQIFNNWSPYLVSDFCHTVSLGCEYFCLKDDDFWNMSDQEIKDFAIDELVQMNFIDLDDVIDFHVERVEKAYPAYFDSYQSIDQVIQYLNQLDNFYTIGRNGQHRYNNMDHSMLTGIEVCHTVLSGRKDRSNIWGVNKEQEYVEVKKNVN